MKKLLIIILAATAGLPAFAQQSNSSTPANSMTVAEANKINGIAQPVMKDGKPYSQWVAEEKAKNQVAAVKASTPDPANFVVTKSAVPGSQVKPSVKEENKVSDNESETIIVKPKDPAPVKEVAPANAAKTTEPMQFPKGTATASQPAPEVQQNIKGTSLDPDAKPVIPVKQTTAPATVPAQNSGNTVPAVEKPVKKE